MKSFVFCCCLPRSHSVRNRGMIIRYERNDHKGCPLYGAEVGVNGTTVGEACCICRGDGCELVEGWKDSYGDPCLWVSFLIDLWICCFAQLMTVVDP